MLEQPDVFDGYDLTVVEEAAGVNAVLVLLTDGSRLVVEAENISYSSDGAVMLLQSKDGKNIAVYGPHQWRGGTKVLNLKGAWIPVTT